LKALLRSFQKQVAPISDTLGLVYFLQHIASLWQDNLDRSVIVSSPNFISHVDFVIST